MHTYTDWNRDIYSARNILILNLNPLETNDHRIQEFKKAENKKTLISLEKSKDTN